MFTFHHFNFNVLDLERSLRFYKDALDLTPVRAKEAADGSFKLVYLGTAPPALSWSSPGCGTVPSPTTLERASSIWPSPCPTWTPPTNGTRPWAVSALRIPPWASIS